MLVKILKKYLFIITIIAHNKNVDKFFTNWLKRWLLVWTGGPVFDFSTGPEVQF